MNSIEHAQFSLVTLIIKLEDDTELESHYQLSQYSEKQSKDGLLRVWITISVSIFVMILAIIVAVIVYGVTKNREVAEN